MSERSNTALLINDMIESGEKILRYTAGMSLEDFTRNEIVIDAVIRNFEVIGEAANRLSEEFKERWPTIDWHRVRGFRNRLVHDYAGIDYSIIWSVISSFLPGMLHQLKSIS